MAAGQGQHGDGRRSEEGGDRHGSERASCFEEAHDQIGRAKRLDGVEAARAVATRPCRPRALSTLTAIVRWQRGRGRRRTHRTAGDQRPGDRLRARNGRHAERRSAAGILSPRNSTTPGCLGRCTFCWRRATPSLVARMEPVRPMRYRRRQLASVRSRRRPAALLSASAVAYPPF